MKQFKYGLFIILTIVSVFLTGCDNPEERRRAKEQAVLAERINSERAYTNKINRYVEFYNFISDGLSDEQKNLVHNERAFEHSDFRAIRISTYFLSQSLDYHIKELKTMSAEMSALDRELKSYENVIHNALQLFEKFDNYLKSKKYEEDKGNYGKELFVKYLAEMEKLSAARSSFFHALEAELANREIRKIEQYKADGRMLEYHNAKAQGFAKQVLTVLKENFDNRAFSECDSLILALESEMNGLIQAFNDAKAKGYKHEGAKDWNDVHQELSNFVGVYRELKQDKNTTNMNRLIDQYNKAIETYNQLN